MNWPVPMATPRQIAAIHVLAARAGMDDDTRRDFLTRETSESSTKALSAAQAGHVIDKLKALAGDTRGVNGAVAGLDSPVARKMRALWIAGWNLGLVRDRTDRAMLSFLERQAGVSHTRFLRDPRQAAAAIEGLKGWLAREGKVAWPEPGEPTASKRAVLDAQWIRLIAIGAVVPWVAHQPLSGLDDYAFKVARRQGWCFFDSHHYDQVQQALGRKLRAALAAKEETP